MALARLRAAQRALIDEYRAEYFCDDLDVPASAFGWDEKAIREYFEAGGGVGGNDGDDGKAAVIVDASESEAAPSSAALMPSRPAANAATATASDAQRPCIVLVGDSITEMGGLVGGGGGGGGGKGGGGGGGGGGVGTGGGGGGGGTSTLAMPVVPDGYFATIGAQCPAADDGPGWGVLLAHNYLSLRRTCDVINRCVCTRQQSRLRPSLTHALARLTD